MTNPTTAETIAAIKAHKGRVYVPVTFKHDVRWFQSPKVEVIWHLTEALEADHPSPWTVLEVDGKSLYLDINHRFDES